MTNTKLGTRKICKVNYSYSISLPKVWLDNAGLKQNELVSLYMNNKNELVIKPHRNDVIETVQ